MTIDTFDCDRCGTTVAHTHGDLPERAAFWRPNLVQFLCGKCNAKYEAEEVENTFDCDHCGVRYDESKGDGYCGLCPSCADATENEDTLTNAKWLIIGNEDDFCWVYWSNEDGWGDKVSATRFTIAERKAFTLLPDGAYGWVAVPE
jgi:hypothetical protein